MTRLRQSLQMIVGAILFAALITAIVALPGFLADRDSTAPLQTAKRVQPRQSHQTTARSP